MNRPPEPDRPAADRHAADPPEPDPPEPDLTRPAEVPRAAAGRLSLYYRELHRLLAAGQTKVNSRQLGALVDVSPEVVRRDLGNLSVTGRRGVGYGVEALITRIGELLGSGIRWRVVLVGVGSLGDALLRYRGFEQQGFHLAAAFDANPAKIGRCVGGVRIDDYADIQRIAAEVRPDLGIIAVPLEAAPDVAAMLVSVGVSGLLNFTPLTLKVPPAVAIINVDLASELHRLAFAVNTGR